MNSSDIGTISLPSPARRSERHPASFPAGVFPIGATLLPEVTLQNSIYFNILPKTAYGQQAIVITLPHSAVLRNGNVEAKLWASPTSTTTLDAAIAEFIELREQVKPGKLDELECLAKYRPAAPPVATPALDDVAEPYIDINDVIERYHVLRGAAYLASNADLPGGSALHHLTLQLGQAMGIQK